MHPARGTTMADRDSTARGVLLPHVPRPGAAVARSGSRSRRPVPGCVGLAAACCPAARRRCRRRSPRARSLPRPRLSPTCRRRSARRSRRRHPGEPVTLARRTSTSSRPRRRGFPRPVAPSTCSRSCSGPATALSAPPSRSRRFRRPGGCAWAASVSLTLPRNTTGAARTFHFQIAARGPNDQSSASPGGRSSRRRRFRRRRRREDHRRSRRTPAWAPDRARPSTQPPPGSSLTVQWAGLGRRRSCGTRRRRRCAELFALGHRGPERGYRYRAVFTSHGRSATTLAATLTVTAPVVVAPSLDARRLPSPVAQAQRNRGRRLGAPDHASADEGGDRGKSATFTATASGVPTPTVQWQFSTDGGNQWAPIAGATSTSYTLGGLTLLEIGYEYRGRVHQRPPARQTTTPGPR